MAKIRIKRIDPLSLGKALGLIYALLGLLIGIIFGLFLGLATYFMPWTPIAAFGMFMVVIFFLIYGVMGFISGIVVAFLYNLIASWMGGIEIETA